jgi:hypothetical protein
MSINNFFPVFFRPPVIRPVKPLGINTMNNPPIEPLPAAVETPAPTPALTDVELGLIRSFKEEWDEWKYNTQSSRLEHDRRGISLRIVSKGNYYSTWDKDGIEDRDARATETSFSPDWSSPLLHPEVYNVYKSLSDAQHKRVCEESRARSAERLKISLTLPPPLI